MAHFSADSNMATWMADNVRSFFSSCVLFPGQALITALSCVIGVELPGATRCDEGQARHSAQ